MMSISDAAATVPDVFADAAGWGHLVDSNRKHHDRAAGDALVTTNYILMELAALLIKALRTPHPKIVAFVESLRTSPHVQIVHVDSTLDSQAWKWSLVDCASFGERRGRESR